MSYTRKWSEPNVSDESLDHAELVTNVKMAWIMQQAEAAVTSY